ncbi:CMD domain protein [Microbacterium sp. KSW4-11]|uniref:CMD domain protein n=1 Tax=Microbacterium gawkjiense TaxID=3067309 RepID=A0ABU3G841_9MICO|nr:CMD domain protein [Microbacterium sp. KSW4-11]MDT3315986.1 CMD domain protein [Microbacterium sp. KSW4-11]
MTADIIDLLAGITPGSPLAETRALRPQARANAQRSFEALLEPAQPGDFPLAERYAIAAFTARIHRFDAATAFYDDLLREEDAALADAIADLAADAAQRGPVGAYREPGLAGESTPAVAWHPASAAVGDRLPAALAHTHLLVFRPREASPQALRALTDAGWSADAIVSLSQLVAFLAFQLRLAWGLRVLGASASAHTTAHTLEGAAR